MGHLRKRSSSARARAGDATVVSTSSAQSADSGRCQATATAQIDTTAPRATSGQPAGLMTPATATTGVSPGTGDVCDEAEKEQPHCRQFPGGGSHGLTRARAHPEDFTQAQAFRTPAPA